jgi:hypothetical protein
MVLMPPFPVLLIQLQMTDLAQCNIRSSAYNALQKYEDAMQVQEREQNLREIRVILALNYSNIG